MLFSKGLKLGFWNYDDAIAESFALMCVCMATVLLPKALLLCACVCVCVCDFVVQKCVFVCVCCITNT